MAHGQAGAGVLGRQFAGPRGPMGWVAGLVMARLNTRANQWMVELLDVGPDDRVVDVGCGPGLAVEAAAARARRGFVAGVDASPLMVAQASRRNRAAIREGRVEIRRGGAAALSYPDARFTRAASLNSLQFWPEAERGLRELHRVLEPGGRLALVLVARSGDADPGRPVPGVAVGPPWVREVAGLLHAAGFADVGLDAERCGPLLHWALLARR